MIVSAQDILAAIPWREQSLEEFAAEYRRLTALGLDRKRVAQRFGVDTNAVRNRVYKARKAGLIERPERADRPVGVPRQLMPCGTNAANARHRRHGEKPCDACLQARRAYIAGWKRSRRAVTAS